jgi:hypothetical protein
MDAAPIVVEPVHEAYHCFDCVGIIFLQCEYIVIGLLTRIISLPANEINLQIQCGCSRVTYLPVIVEHTGKYLGLPT